MARVLLIDDDESFRKMLRLVLKKLGHEVVEAVDGKHALRLCLDEAPDVVLTDLIMPDTDGMEIIRKLRRSVPNVKIIAMSGGGRIDALDYLDIAKRLGAARTLNKPFSTDELVVTIECALSRD